MIRSILKAALLGVAFTFGCLLCDLGAPNDRELPPEPLDLVAEVSSVDTLSNRATSNQL